MTIVHTLPGGATLTDVGVPGETAKPACIVLPGGGYAGWSDRAAEPVAEWLESIGVRGFVLRYRVAPNLHPASLDDTHTAIRLVRSSAAEWGVNPAVVGIMGFSAGGHLGSTASTHWTDRIERPEFAVLVYSVINMRPPLADPIVIVNLLGPDPDEALIDNLSNELQVTSETPTTFLVHGVNDELVSVQNSLIYAKALSESHVPFELHCPQDGPHGFVMGEPGTPTDWLPAGKVWILATIQDILSKTAAQSS